MFQRPFRGHVVFRFQYENFRWVIYEPVSTPFSRACGLSDDAGLRHSTQLHPFQRPFRGHVVFRASDPESGYGRSAVSTPFSRACGLSARLAPASARTPSAGVSTPFSRACGLSVVDHRRWDRNERLLFQRPFRGHVVFRLHQLLAPPFAPSSFQRPFRGHVVFRRNHYGWRQNCRHRVSTPFSRACGLSGKSMVTITGDNAYCFNALFAGMWSFGLHQSSAL